MFLKTHYFTKNGRPNHDVAAAQFAAKNGAPPPKAKRRLAKPSGAFVRGEKVAG
jgi:hypothetical protein